MRRAPVWQRLPAAKHSTKKAMVALKLDVTQDRDTENTVGRRTPGQRTNTVTRTRPQAPHPVPGPTSVLTDSSEQLPDDDESEELPGEEEICQEASQESADEGDTEHQG